MKCLNKEFHRVLTKEHGYRTYLCPCGKCYACNFNRSQDWSNRAMIECDDCIKDGCNCYFLTLTYRDEKLPIGENNNPTLYYKDVQNFFKRLRKDGLTFRYIVCGEYGHRRYRPHYHAVIFTTASFSELRHLVTKHWGAYYAPSLKPSDYGKADVQIARNPSASCRYVCKYITKFSEDDTPKGAAKPFIRASVRFGIRRFVTETVHSIKASITKLVRNGINYVYLNTRRVQIPYRILKNCFTFDERDAKHGDSIFEYLQMFHSVGYSRLMDIAANQRNWVITRNLKSWSVRPV